MARKPTYAAALAKDRDKYRVQRDRLAVVLRGLLLLHAKGEKNDNAAQTAEKLLIEIYGEDE